jgi:predicted transcriptional regulator
MNEELLVESIKTVQVTDDSKTGRTAKILRMMRLLSLRVVSEKMNCSAAFLHDLENGRRHWSKKWIDRFNNAIRELEK